MLQPPLTEFDLRPTELTGPFWDAAAEHRLIVQRCSRCEACFFRPEIACPHCLSQEWRWVGSSGRGSVYSFSVVHRPPTRAFTAPFVFAIIELVEGFTMFSNIVGLEPDA